MSRLVLNQRQTFALLTLMQAEYVASGLSDVAFAAVAGEKLEMADLNSGHIGTARKTLDLPSNARPGDGSSRSTLALAASVEDLQHLYTALSLRVEEYVKKTETLQRDLHLNPPGRTGK